MTTDTFRNPILSGFNPDPSICHVPGKGYFVATSTFEFFPGLPIYHSTDLIHWNLIGHAINRRSQGVDMRTVESSAGLWAPTFRYNKGKWYMICSCFWRLRIVSTGPEVISSGFYVSTDDIFDDSKWSEAVYFEEVGFDQDLLFDDDGKVYQTVTRFDFDAPPVHGNPRIQSFINEIDLATGRSLTAPVLAKASDLGVAEGCHILKRDGWYYFFTAEGGTQGGHRECVYRSRSPTGPFEAPPEGVNPVVYNGNHPDIQNTGHMDLIEGDDGKWISVFLGVRPVFPAREVGGAMGMPTHLGRESFMATVEWVDGWPVVNDRKPIELVGEARGLTYLPGPTDWSDDFNSDHLDKGWYNVRTPLYPCHSLSERPGTLALRGGPHDIAVEHSPSMLLRKQVLFDLDWATEMTFDPARNGEEAGTLVWLTATMYAALGVVRSESGSLQVVFRRPGELGKIVRDILPCNLENGEAVKFSIKARKDAYELSYGIGENMTSAGSVPTSSFVPLFTGVHIGLYAQGSDEIPCRQSAFFHYAKWSAA